MQRTKGQKKRKGPTGPKKRSQRISSSLAGRNTMRVSTVSAPAITSAIVSGVGVHTFGQAPPQEDFPEGGIRLSGTSRAPLFVAHTTTSTTLTGGFQDSSSGAYCSMLNCLDYDTRIGGSGLAGLGRAVSIFPVGVLNTLYNFKKYRTRYLRLRFVPTTGTNTPGRVSFGYSRDWPSTLSQTSSALGGTWLNTSQDYVPDSRVSVTTPVWQACELVMLDEKKTTTRDELFFIGSTPTDVGSGFRSSYIRQAVQGSIDCYLNVNSADATITYGSLYFDYTVDAYDFNAANVVQSDSLGLLGEPLPQEKLHEASQREVTESKGEVKDPLKIRGDYVKVAGRDIELLAVVTESKNQPAVRTDGRQVGTQDAGGTWFRKS